MKNSAKILLFFLFFSFVSNVFSQQNGAKDSTAINSLYEGSWALQFKIASNFTLDSFDGSNLAFKYHFSKKSALRVGVTLKTYNTDSDYEIIDDRAQDITENNIINNRNDFYITLKPLYIFYPVTNRRTLFFIGAGPYFQYGRNENRYKKNYNNGDTLVYVSDEKITNYRYGVGVSFIGGVEVFITKYLSLHAEYGSNFTYDYYEQKMERLGEDTDGRKFSTNSKKSTDGYNFSANAVMFGVSVYF